MSVVTGDGLDALKLQLDRLCFGEASPAATLAINARHVRAVDDARDALRRALDQLPFPRAELLALELREALDALGGIVGRITPDDLLGRVFAGFCIGK